MTKKEFIMKLSIFKRAFRQDINLIRASYVIGVLAIIGSIFWFSKNKYEDSAGTLIRHFKSRDSIIEKAIQSDTTKSPFVGRLKEQFYTIAKVKESYVFMAQRFNTYGYTFTIFFAISSIVSGILGFLLIQKGWNNTDNFYLKSSFLITFFCSTLFGILPNVFSTKDNTKNNLEKYNYFSSLQLDIYDLVKDNKGLLAKNVNGRNDSLLYIELQKITRGIQEHQDLYFDTNIDKVPAKIKPSLE